MDYCLERRQKIAEKWALTDQIVLVYAGTPVPIPGRGDQVYPFRSHSEYFYLTDRNRPGGVLAFDPREGWTDFVPYPTAEEALWQGPAQVEGTDFSQFSAWLRSRPGRTVACLGSEGNDVIADEDLTAQVRQALTKMRWRKDEFELGRMRQAAQATAAGYAAIEPFLRPGITERHLQIELEAEFFRNGAEGTAYDTIVASGPNSAVLHFAPTSRVLSEGELVLIDAGAEYQSYASDVTRTYPVSGTFDARQQQIYDIVLAAEQRAMEACRAGVEYKDVHLIATRVLVEGLIDLNLLRGTRDFLIEEGAHALFFPHGIGHMVGLGVRDAGGYLPGRIRSERPGLRYLRIDLPLMPGYVVTIEPGIYFVPTILQDVDRRRTHRDSVNWTLVDSFMDFGGIRIEDNVHVTEEGNEVLTSAIPKLFGR